MLARAQGCSRELSKDLFFGSFEILESFESPNLTYLETESPTASPNITVRQSILLSSAKNVGSTKDPEDDSGYTPTEDRPREILDKEQKLYRVYTDDGLKETAHHVVDFAGFYPIWPIIEFSMVPTGASKDERMVSFTKCVSALLGEMLYVVSNALTI